ncbi:MAG: hypothetical protein IPL61_08100 [Myxococcales bacterium]|nr:hypothetical protein [Myxococcales bacterium]
MNHRILVVMLVAPLALACGKKKEESGGGGGGATVPKAGKVIAACDQRATTGELKVCLEYTGSTWTAQEAKARCSAEGQIFLEGACPTDGVVFSCVQMQGQGMEGINRYYGDAEKAKTVCAQIGKPL